MRVFVTGVKGQLGYDVMNELEKQGLEGIGVDIDEMDITDADQVNKVIKEAAPDAGVLQLKSLEAFAKAADGKATKIIIPSEIQGIAGLAKSVVEVGKEN